MRAFIGGSILAVASLLLAAAAWPPAGLLVAGGLPPTPFQLSLQLNGRPAFIGHTAPKGDGGTKGIVDGGAGNIVRTVCYSAACVCPGLNCSCGDKLASSGAGVSTNGQYVPALGSNTMVMGLADGVVSTAAASGSLLLDGGAGAECDHWVMQ